LDARFYPVNEADSKYQDNGEGDAGRLERGGYVIISNHFGYLDGIILGSLFPVIFVSKKEVKSWPLVGQWTTLCGTVFSNRQKKGLIPLSVTGISQRLKQGANILLFPEGAATNGERMLPFQTAPLAAPLRSLAIIVPVTLAYQSIVLAATTQAGISVVGPRYPYQQLIWNQYGGLTTTYCDPWG
jgi:1-acyl-sn-glycerol-3-phosphate acyltransferase